MSLITSNLIKITYINAWLPWWYFIRVLASFFRCFHGKMQNIMREFLTIRHSVALLLFRQRIEIARSQISKKKKYLNEILFLELHHKTIVDVPFDIYEQYWKHFLDLLCNKRMIDYENFKICPKKCESSYCSWNL